MMGKHRYDEYRKTNLFQNDKVIRPRLSRRTRQQTNESIRIESEQPAWPWSQGTRVVPNEAMLKAILADYVITVFVLDGGRFQNS